MEITWSFPFAELFHIFKANQDLTRASKQGNESRKCSMQNVLEAMIPELNIRNIMKYHRNERSKQIHTRNIIFSKYHESILYHCELCDRKIQTNTAPKHHIQDHGAFYLIVIFVTQKIEINTNLKQHNQDHEAFIIKFLMKKSKQILI